MNFIKTISTSLLLLSIVLLSGCEKEGPAGADGNANVVSTTFTSSAWTFNSPSWMLSYNYPAITQEIINTGAVLVYIRVNNSYNQLPLTFYQSSDYSTTIEVSNSVGGVNIFWTDSDLVQPINPGTQTFKVVVIAASAKIQNPGVDYSNYEDVESAFNLKD